MTMFFNVQPGERVQTCDGQAGVCVRIFFSSIEAVYVLWDGEQEETLVNTFHLYPVERIGETLNDK
jgi:hypothetical protein